MVYTTFIDPAEQEEQEEYMREYNAWLDKYYEYHPEDINEETYSRNSNQDVLQDVSGN